MAAIYTILSWIAAFLLSITGIVVTRQSPCEWPVFCFLHRLFGRSDAPGAAANSSLRPRTNGTWCCVASSLQPHVDLCSAYMWSSCSHCFFSLLFLSCLFSHVFRCFGQKNHKFTSYQRSSMIKSAVTCALISVLRIEHGSLGRCEWPCNCGARSLNPRAAQPAVLVCLLSRLSIGTCQVQGPYFLKIVFYFH